MRTPARCRVEYSSMDAWPADRTKRSRFGHSGSAGSYSRKYCQSEYTTGAKPIGAPGWPEFACCTASIESVRMVLIQSWSMFGWLTVTPERALGHPQTRSQGLDAGPGRRMPGSVLQKGIARLSNGALAQFRARARTVAS